MAMSYDIKTMSKKTVPEMAEALKAATEREYPHLGVFVVCEAFNQRIVVRIVDPATDEGPPLITFEVSKWKESELLPEVLAIIRQWLAERTE